MEKRKGCFWSLHYFLEGTHWTAVCGSGVSGILPGTVHQFGDRPGLLPFPLQPLDSAKWGGHVSSPASGEICQADCTRAHPGQITGRGWGNRPPCACQLPTPKVEGTRLCVPTRVTSGQGSAPAEVNCPTPRLLEPLSQVQEKQSTKSGCCLEPPSLGTGKPLKEASKDHRSAWTEEVTSRQICLFFLFYFPLSYTMVIRNIIIKQQE